MREVLGLEAQAVQDAAHLGLDGVAAEVLVGVTGASRGGELLVGGIVAELGLELAQALLRLQHLDLGRHDLVEHGEISHLDRFLLQVADTGALGEQDAPLVGVLLAGDDVEQRGLAGAVGADERQPVVLLEAERHVREEGAPSERFRYVLDLHDHVARTPSKRQPARWPAESIKTNRL